MRESQNTQPTSTPGRPTPQGTDVNFALRELSLAFRAHDRDLAAQMNLKTQEYVAMEQILDGRGQVGPVELASRLGLAVPTTSELLDRLQKLGHVERHRDESDGRRVRITPAPGTVAAIVQAITPAMELLSRVAEQYSPAEQQVIVRFLREVTAALTSE